MKEGVLTNRAKFEIDQLVAASEAARNFAALRKKAKLSPRLILENNKPDSVLMNIADYEALYELIDALEDELFILRAAMRVKKADEGEVRKYSLDEVLSDEDKKLMEKAKNWDISDDDLFD